MNPMMPAIWKFFVGFVGAAAVANAAPAPKPAQVDVATIDAALRRGADFLVRTQHANGAWGGPTRTKNLNIYAPLPGAHQAFQAGASGLALAGLHACKDGRPEVAAAIGRATPWMLTQLPNLRRADGTTTYNIWGHAYGLRALTRIYQNEADPAKREAVAKVAQGQVDLTNRYEDVNGGWGYLDVFDGMTTQKPSGMPTCFMTATVLLAMAEARDVMGVRLNDTVVKRALTSLRWQRTPDFSYTYAFSHRWRPRTDINRPAGSLARSQTCNACLRVFDDRAITDDVLRTWADRFLAREGFLSNGRKRPVPHEAQFRIAGYFYYYGVFYFTQAADLLPAREHARYARRLAPVLLALQEKDGSWWDYPLYDYHQPYGTGYALLALAWCRDALSGKGGN